MTHVTAGMLLAGKYRVEALIGRGGMGTVWRAQHLGLNAPIAVKLLDLADFHGSPGALNRFHLEAHAAASIRSPHVVQIFDHGIDEATGAPFIAMELLEGESLAQRLSRAGRIAPAEVAHVFTHVARALSRAHEAQIVHRDLKPDNVFLVRNEDEEIAKVLDFGIAKAHAQDLNVDSATRTGAVMGTAHYMSPEQISGSKTVDFRTDIWALGVMACECLTGVRPFDAETIGGLALKICVGPIPNPSSFAAVPAGFDDWFARITQREPAQRFASAREAADALRSLCLADPRLQRASAPPFVATLAEPEFTRLGTEAPLSRSTNGSAQPPKPRRTPVLAIAAGVFAVLALASVALLRSAKHGQDEVLPVALTSAAAPASANPADITPVTAASVIAEPASCTPNSKQCTGATPQTCVAGQWVAGAVSAGSCGAECTPASSPARCNGLFPQACNADGKWQNQRACNRSEVCQSGSCKPWQPVVKPTLSGSSPRSAACDPSYTLDDQGHKHFKPECFK